MHFTGTKFWSSKDRYYSQENNPTEAYLKATLKDRALWLESCGPTSAVNCMASMGKKLTITCPGTYAPQPEEVMMDYFNDPRNAAKLKEVRDLGDLGIPGNRVPQYYPLAAYEVFGVRARFEWGATWDQITRELDRGRAVQLCLEKPGHYIAVVAYTRERDGFLLFNDSWGARFPDGKGGFNRRMGTEELRTNVKPFRIIYGV